jgi:hypothetical protein
VCSGVRGFSLWPPLAPTLQKPRGAAPSDSLENYLYAKPWRTFGQRSNLLLAILRFVVFVALVHVLLAVLDQAIEQACRLACHGRDRFRGPEARAPAAVLRSPIALTA